MAISEGRKGKISIMGTVGKSSAHTIAEQGEWSITGISRNVINYSAFGNDIVRSAVGILNPGAFSFSGYFDATDTTGQAAMLKALTSGTIIYAGSSFGAPWGMQFWANDDTALSGYGYFHLAPTSVPTDGMHITSIEYGQSVDGLCSINVSGIITGNAPVVFHTSS